MIRKLIKLCNSRVSEHFLRKPNEPFKRLLTSNVVIPKLTNYCHIQNLRYKSKSSKKGQTSETESNDDYDSGQDAVQDKHTKVLKISVTSLRVDAILKSSLGMARNKVETLFYESKIRLNGEKIKKKSASVSEGDEIDLIKGEDIKNPNFMNVARVEILSITAEEDTISVKIRRHKSLTVDAYT